MQITDHHLGATRQEAGGAESREASALLVCFRLPCTQDHVPKGGTAPVGVPPSDNNQENTPTDMTGQAYGAPPWLRVSLLGCLYLGQVDKN